MTSHEDGSYLLVYVCRGGQESANQPQGFITLVVSTRGLGRLSLSGGREAVHRRDTKLGRVVGSVAFLMLGLNIRARISSTLLDTGSSPIVDIAKHHGQPLRHRARQPGQGHLRGRPARARII